jgi:oxygen-dependent protoporphyrinogen oxidase
MAEVVVLGGGIAGLAAAHRLVQAGAPDLRVRVVEAGDRWGGKILSERRDGYLLESGPDSLVPQKPEALALVRELGLGDRLVRSRDAHRGLYFWRGGRLVKLPPGFAQLVPERWGDLLRSPLLSWRGKVRFLAERLVPPRSGEHDESVADFVRRRLGREVLDRLAEPVLAHIHVADIERMSLLATYPRLRQLESRYGSLTRGVETLRRSRPASASPPPLFWALAGGVGELVDALTARLPAESLLLGRRALRLELKEGGTFSEGELKEGGTFSEGELKEGGTFLKKGGTLEREEILLNSKEGGTWRVVLDGGEILEADAVVLALPAFAAADLLADVDPELGAGLRAIRYVSMATLSLGFRRADLGRELDGFGFFVPREEKRRILACTWSSSKFDGRAPEGSVLLRIFLGGARREADLELGDDELTAAVLGELREMLGGCGEPELTRLYRIPRGYPQYDVGHVERVQKLEKRLPHGLFLAGSGYHGVGLPACIASAHRAVSGVLETRGFSPVDPGATP